MGEREREEKRNGARRSEPKYRRSGRVSAPPLETLRERERDGRERERSSALLLSIEVAVVSFFLHLVFCG